ncbi:MAG: phytanoyl-CoA dioxygenase family protein [Pseudomonadota bacterium]
MTEVLTEDQMARYRESGAIVVENRVGADVLAAIDAEIDRFRDEARALTESNDQVDLEDTHTPDNPRVRRIKRPDLNSDVMRALLYSDTILAPVRDLLGPDLRLHTSKLNMKSAGFGAAIEWHQDFAFYPHTNDDLLAVGVLLDDMDIENGPLMVFEGSHRGPIHDHHAKGVFAGAMDLARDGYDTATATALTGSRGSITLHHSRIVHGSSLNRSDRDRRILFFEIGAADAFPIMGGMTEFESLAGFDAKMLCGTPGRTPRLTEVPVRIPQPQPDRAGSIYEIQDGLDARAFEKI